MGVGHGNNKNVTLTFVFNLDVLIVHSNQKQMFDSGTYFYSKQVFSTKLSYFMKL